MTKLPVALPPPPETSHLYWLYLLAAVPVLTEGLERGSFPTAARGYLTEVVMTVLILVGVNLVVRQSKRIAEEMRSRLRSTEQLQHANRLATVGQLAAGIAHELGSPLQVVAGRAKMVAVGEVVEGEAKESAQIICEQAQRMTQIIRGILDFARRRPAQRSVVDLHDIAQQTRRVLGAVAKKRAVVLEVETTSPTPRPVFVDAVQIQQVLTNLVMNAIQAVPQGGHVNIVVGPPAPAGAGDDAFVRVAVSDDGPGIREQDKARVFEPFFTTKDVGEGTGLGLAVAHGLVLENGGAISVESEAGRGACFAVLLPTYADKAGHA